MATDDWINELKSITLAIDGEETTTGPAGAEDDYQSARKALAKAESALHQHVLAVAAQRQALPLGPKVPNYEFSEGPTDLDADDDSAVVTLLDLFGDHNELIIYHLMFHPDDDEACPMCSSIVDGFTGIAKHLNNRCALAIAAKAPINKVRAWGRYRGWHGLRLISSSNNSFTTDFGTEGSKGAQIPAVSVFTRTGSTIHHRYTQSADFADSTNGGVDQIWPIWHLVDLLPSGRTDWLPDGKYN